MSHHSNSPQRPLTDLDDLARDLATAIALHHADGPLLLDLAHPATRAIVALFAALDANQKTSRTNDPASGTDDGAGDGDSDGDWSGADTVQTVTNWLLRIGIEPHRGLAQLVRRVRNGSARGAVASAGAPARETTSPASSAKVVIERADRITVPVAEWCTAERLADHRTAIADIASYFDDDAVLADAFLTAMPGPAARGVTLTVHRSPTAPDTSLSSPR